MGLNNRSYLDHVRIKIKYKIPSYYIDSLTTVCRSDACY